MAAGGVVWSAQDCAPADIEAALRSMLKEQFHREEAYAPARVLNLVVIVDRDWRGEILNRLERVGRYHASRTILCAVEPRRDLRLDGTELGCAHALSSTQGAHCVASGA